MTNAEFHYVIRESGIKLRSAQVPLIPDKEAILKRAIRLYRSRNEGLHSFASIHGRLVYDLLLTPWMKTAVDLRVAELWPSLENFIQVYHEIEPESPEFLAALESYGPTTSHKNAFHLGLQSCKSCFGESVGVVFTRALLDGFEV